MEMTTDPAAAPPLEPARPAIPIPWAAIIWLFALVAVCYLPILTRLVRHWDSDDNMGHGFFVFPLAVYIAWQKRDEIFGHEFKKNWFGLVIMAWGIFQELVGSLGAELFLQRTAFVITLAGMVLFLGGGKLFRILLFPLFLTCFMVPLPAVIFNQITFPLQTIATVAAEETLNLVGYPCVREGHILQLASGPLNVVEACSGIRSPLSLTFLSLVYGYFFEASTTIRGIIFFSTIPIAIATNGLRVTLTGVISEHDKALAQGLFHDMEGWVIFMIALFILIGFHRILVWFTKGVVNARAARPAEPQESE